MDLQGFRLSLSVYLVLCRVLNLIMVGQLALACASAATVGSHLAAEVVAQVALRAKNSCPIDLLSQLPAGARLALKELGLGPS